MTNKQAVILAAGRGSRLGEHGLLKPKPLTRINNITIIDNLMQGLIACGFTRVVVVDGYLAEKLEDHLRERYAEIIELVFITNEQYHKTNNLFSLWLARDYLKDGFYLFEADIWFSHTLLRRLVDDSREQVAVVDKYHKHMNGTVAKLDENGYVNRLYMGFEQDELFNYQDSFKTVNIWKLGHEYCQQQLIPHMNEAVEQKEVNIYYEHILRDDIADGQRFGALVADKAEWWEIDTPADIIIAEILFR